jgi:hypothetical protein
MHKSPEQIENTVRGVDLEAKIEAEVSKTRKPIARYRKTPAPVSELMFKSTAKASRYATNDATECLSARASHIAASKISAKSVRSAAPSGSVAPSHLTSTCQSRKSAAQESLHSMI